ncbi:MAG: hypothetical protein IBJ11_12525 [Phycisphaerales bacterium]|nr:hypothetical protein [Phycisphaerales bacterium]
MPTWKQRAAETLPPGLVMLGWKLKRLLAPSASERAERSFFRIIGKPNRVLYGPFAGMKYVQFAYGQRTSSKTVGSYESELFPWLDRLVAAEPDVVVDIGTAEGFYAVGMALAVPGAQVIGYDLVPLCQHQTRKLAARNGVESRLEVRGRCESAALAADLDTASCPVVICDCEGGEDTLLRPESAPGLRKALILVEVHEHLVPGLGKSLASRFEQTHRVERLEPSAPAPAEIARRLNISETQAKYAVEPPRPAGNFWMLFTPHSFNHD